MIHQIDSEIFNISSVKIRTLEPVAAVIPFQDSSMGPFNTFGLSVITLEDEDGNTGKLPYIIRITISWKNVFSRFFFIARMCLTKTFILYYIGRYAMKDSGDRRRHY